MARRVSRILASRPSCPSIHLEPRLSQGHIAGWHQSFWKTTRSSHGTATCGRLDALCSRCARHSPCINEIRDVAQVASGERPFHTLIEEQKVIIALHDGQVPPRPPGVWDPLWNVSTACCALAAASRPRAEAISTRLGVLLEIVLGTASTPGPVKRDPNETHRVTRLTTSLSVLAARLEVTDEAADDPPIVKRILGSAVLIVKYAEVRSHAPCIDWGSDCCANRKSTRTRSTCTRWRRSRRLWRRRSRPSSPGGPSMANYRSILRESNSVPILRLRELADAEQ